MFGPKSPCIKYNCENKYSERVNFNFINVYLVCLPLMIGQTSFVDRYVDLPQFVKPTET